MTKKPESSTKQKNRTVSEDLLSSYRSALYRVKDFFDTIDFDESTDINERMKIVQSILSAGEKLGKNIETLVVLEKKVASEEMDKNKIRGNVKLSLLEGNEI